MSTKEIVWDIKWERSRQKQDHKFTCEHDDQWIAGELLMAADAYMTNDAALWPWADSKYSGHKHTKRERLIKAAALIVAEIERMDRLPEEENK